MRLMKRLAKRRLGRKAATLGVACVGVFVFSGVAAGSASAAEPQFVHCIETEPGTGEYPTFEACVKGEEKGEEPREWERVPVAPGEPIPFWSFSGPGTLETVGGNTVTCAQDVNDGVVINATEDRTTVRFERCNAFGVVPCKTAGEEEGVIETNRLRSKLRYINHVTKEVGDVLEPARGEVLAEFECAGIPIEVKGSVIGVVPAGAFEAELEEEGELLFAQTEGVQSVKEYEMEEPAGSGTWVKVPDFLETKIGAEGEWEESGEETTDTITFTEPILITRP